MKRNTICLWCAHDLDEAARIYAKKNDSTVSGLNPAPSGFPGGEAMMEMPKIGVIKSELAVCDKA